MTRVTYVPLENGDPITTSFGGFAFRSGEPVDIPDDAKVLQTVRRETGKTTEGETLHKGFDVNVPLVDVLKSNPFFRVEGSEAPSKAKPGRPRMPKTPEEYKGFAMAWITAHEEKHDKLAARWDDESALREKLGVHDDGEIVSYLRPFFDAKFHDLKKAAA